MKLIVGLGNPGKKYDNTRHNVGFMIVDKYVVNNDLGKYKEKFNASYLECNLYKEKVIFLKPLSFMNLSGQVVKKFVDFYKVDINDILIIHDDKDINLGSIKLKETGSCAGHNGLLDIETNLHTRNYRRIKVGISNDRSMELKDYVLGNFSNLEMSIINDSMPVIFDAINLFIVNDFEKAMQSCNQKVNVHENNQ